MMLLNLSLLLLFPDSNLKHLSTPLLLQVNSSKYHNASFARLIGQTVDKKTIMMKQILINHDPGVDYLPPVSLQMVAFDIR